MLPDRINVPSRPKNALPKKSLVIREKSRPLQNRKYDFTTMRHEQTGKLDLRPSAGKRGSRSTSFPDTAMPGVMTIVTFAIVISARKHL
jgi:hypothetical protein